MLEKGGKVWQETDTADTGNILTPCLPLQETREWTWQAKDLVSSPGSTLSNGGILGRLAALLRFGFLICKMWKIKPAIAKVLVKFKGINA